MSNKLKNKLNWGLIIVGSIAGGWLLLQTIQVII